MKAGIIGVPVDGEIGSIESTDDVKQEFGMEFHTTLDVVRIQDLSGDTKFIEGAGLKEEQEEVEQAVVEDGDDDGFSIRVRDRRQKDQSWADFVAVEARDGHDGVVIVSTSSAEFIFDLVARMSDPGTRIDRANIALGDFVREKRNFNIQGGGGPTGNANADTIMAWGENIDEDDDIGSIIRRNVESNTNPIVPGTYSYEGWTVHCNVAASGWVEVWDPDWSTSEFVEWLEDDVLPYADGGDD